MHEYRDHTDVLIGDCDCTGACKALCQEKGVQGYPTVMFGDPSALQDYQGPRDFDGLKRHADTALKPACSLSNLDLCDESQKTLIETLQAMPAADLHAEISKSENEIAAVESQFKADVDKLHAKYKSLEDDKKDAIAQVKSAGLGLMKSIQEQKKKTRQASVSEL